MWNEAGKMLLSCLTARRHRTYAAKVTALIVVLIGDFTHNSNAKDACIMEQEAAGELTSSGSIEQGICSCESTLADASPCL